MVRHFKAEIHDLDRVCHIESKMGEFTANFNDLVDAHSERNDEVEWIKAKLAGLEDCSKLNNIKN